MANYVVGIEDDTRMFVCVDADWEARHICQTEAEVYAAIDWDQPNSVSLASSVYEASECTETPWILRLCKKLRGAK